MSTSTRSACGGKRVWTLEDVRTLGVVTDVKTAGEILGMGRSKAYKLASQNQFPVRTIRHGDRYAVPVAALIQILLGEADA